VSDTSVAVLAAGLAIVTGVLVNVLSPWLNKKIEKRSDKATAKRAEQDSNFHEEAERLARDRPALYTYLLGTLIRIAYIGAIFGALSGGVAAVGQVLPYFKFSQYVFAFSQIIALVGTIIVLNIARPAVQMIQEIRAVGRKPDANGSLAASTSSTQKLGTTPASHEPTPEPSTGGTAS
jgi:predicted lipid-binding transport protein (Tim44 family)